MSERILVVDDEQEHPSSLEIVLGGAGYRVSCAKDGEEALAAVEADPPDAVFLDLQIPKLDGMEVLRRWHTSRPDLPVVIVSGQATSGLRSMRRASALSSSWRSRTPAKGFCWLARNGPRARAAAAGSWRVCGSPRWRTCWVRAPP